MQASESRCYAWTKIGTETGRVLYAYTFVVFKVPGLKQAPNPTHTRRAERGNPVWLPSGTADRKEGLWLCRFGIPEKANASL
jgi:hypothetical protein